MKTNFKNLLLLGLLSAPALAKTSTLFTCTPKDGRPGDAVYRVSSVDRADSPNGLLVEKVGPASSRPQPSFEVSETNAVLGYANTYIIFKNNGRSGYLLIHKNNDAAFLDINLFGAPSGLNTNGPRSDYRCTTP